jgi:hypothetical protein
VDQRAARVDRSPIADKPLTELAILYAHQLRRLPSSLAGLKSLRFLDLHGSGIVELRQLRRCGTRDGSWTRFCFPEQACGLALRIWETRSRRKRSEAPHGMHELPSACPTSSFPKLDAGRRGVLGRSRAGRRARRSGSCRPN